MNKKENQRILQIILIFFAFLRLEFFLHFYLSFCFLLFNISFTQEKKLNASKFA